MELAANRSRISLHTGQTSFPVISLEGKEALSTVFDFRVDLLARPEAVPASLLGQTVQLKILGEDRYQRAVTGVITRITELGRHSGETSRDLARARHVYRFTIQPRLALLSRQTDSRVIMDKTVIDVVTDCLLRHGYRKDQIRIHLTRTLPVRPFIVQTDETDLAFVQRLLAREGIWYWFGSHQDSELIYLVDHNANCPYLERGVVYHVAPTGMEQHNGRQQKVGIQRLRVTRRCVPDAWEITDINEQMPETRIHTQVQTQAPRAPLQRPTVQQLFGHGMTSQQDADIYAKQLAERAMVDAHTIEIDGNIAEMGAGLLFSFEPGTDFRPYAGDYLVVEVRHRAAQASGEQVPGQPENQVDTAYRQSARVIPRVTPYRALLPPRKTIVSTFTARIESNNDYAHVDEQGHYRARYLSDRSRSQHTRATIPLRRMQPYDSPAGKPAAMHFPMHDGGEVLLACLNGDPDRPMIVGSLHEPSHKNPVTADNKTQNRLRTWADNELCMDDKTGKECISLRTFRGHNILQLNADALGQKILLHSKQGAIHARAGKTCQLASGDSTTERSGNERNLQAENRSLLRTRQGEIQQQAKRDHRHSARQNARLYAKGDIQYQAGRHKKVHVEENMEVLVKGSGGMRIHVNNDQLHIQAAKDIRITGQGGGDITCVQNGGGFQVKRNGNVELFGKKLVINGSNGVRLNGKVSYSVTSPPSAPNPGVAQAITAAGIMPLRDPQAPVIRDLAWSDRRIDVADTVYATFYVDRLPDDAKAEISIFEWYQDGKKKKVDSLMQQLDHGSGLYQCEWKRSVRQDDEQIVDASDEKAVDLYPLEYRFEVSVGGQRAEQASGPLWLSKRVIVDAVYDSGEAMEDGTQVMLYTASNEKRFALTDAGKAVFDDVVVGGMRIVFNEHTHREL
jgi:type VI secretion system secreted protein VgrG